MSATVVHMLADAATRAPNAEAVVCGADRLSYREFARCVAGFARELVAQGVRGGRVALLMENSIDIVVAMFAAQAAGAQVVPLNPAYTPSELERSCSMPTPPWCCGARRGLRDGATIRRAH